MDSPHLIPRLATMTALATLMEPLWDEDQERRKAVSLVRGGQWWVVPLISDTAVFFAQKIDQDFFHNDPGSNTILGLHVPYKVGVTGVFYIRKSSMSKRELGDLLKRSVPSADTTPFRDTTDALDVVILDDTNNPENVRAGLLRWDLWLHGRAYNGHTICSGCQHALVLATAHVEQDALTNTTTILCEACHAVVHPKMSMN